MIRASRLNSKPRRIVVLTMALLSAFVLAVTLAQPAEASPGGVTLTRYKVINKTSKKYQTGAVFATCKITATGGTCNISKGKSVTRTIGVSLGASRSVVSADLSISSASTVTTTVSCNSPRMKAGQVWKARAVGTKYTYKVQKQQSYGPRTGPIYWRTVATSGYLTAFNPYAASISCGY